MLTFSPLSGRFVWTQQPDSQAEQRPGGRQDCEPDQSRRPSWTCRASTALGLLTAILLTQVTLVGTAHGDPALDAAFMALSTLQPGQDLQQFQPIEAALTAARTEAAVRT